MTTLTPIDSAGRPIAAGEAVGNGRLGIAGMLGACVRRLSTLASPPIRDSRLLVFIVTNDTAVKTPSVKMTPQIAKYWIRCGDHSLTANRMLRLTDDHIVAIYAYQFRTDDLLAAGLTIERHLTASEISLDGILK